MKKICLFCGSMNLGGGTQHMTALLSAALANRGYDVCVLSKSDKNEGSYYKLDQKVKYEVLNNQPYKGKLSWFKDIFLLSGFLKKNNIDVLIMVDVSLGVFSLPVKLLRKKVKHIYWENFNVFYDVENRRINKIRELALRYGDYYITLTDDDAREIRKLFKAKCPVRAIENISPFTASREPYNIDSKRIISVGNMLPVKGFDIALETAKEVFKEAPDWEWHFYGDGVMLDQLKQKAQESGISEKVFFNGRVKDIESAYKKAGLLVMTSRSEGFGLVLVEAHSFKLPTIAFDVLFGPRNIIKDGLNGYLIEPFDQKAMAEKILYLIHNPKVRLEMAEKAAQDLSRFSSEKIGKEWDCVIGEMYESNN